MRSVAECAYAMFFFIALVIHGLFTNEPCFDDPYC